MSRKTEDVSRETTTTKPDLSDDIVLNSIGEKSDSASSDIYAELEEWIEARDRFAKMKDEIDRTLSGINKEIIDRVDTIFKNNIRDSNVCITGITKRKRRYVNSLKFREKHPEIFAKLAIVDGKTAIRLIADKQGGIDGARQFLRNLNPSVYDDNASFTLQDIAKALGADAVDEFEADGCYDVKIDYVGEARLVPIKQGEA